MSDKNKEDIKLLENFADICKRGFNQYDQVKEGYAIERVLRRIKELEEENQKYIVQLTDEQYRNLVDIIRKESKKEFEQKVKDKIEDLKLSGGSNGKDNVENLARELVIEVLEELLEDK